MASASHARLSASASERWLHCPGSVNLCEKLPDSTSAFAEEGTKAHALAEEILTGYLNGKSLDLIYSDLLKKKVDREMLNFVKIYVEHCVDLINGASLKYKKDYEAHVEVLVYFDKYVEGGFGTIDFLLVENDKLIIRDLKYGKGVPVDSYDNSQLILYALGAIEMFDFLYEFKEVSIGIVQPRLDNISVTEYKIEDILNFGEEYKIKAQETNLPNAQIVPGKWCKFCKARAICKSRARLYLSKVNDLLTDLGGRNDN